MDTLPCAIVFAKLDRFEENPRAKPARREEQRETQGPVRASASLRNPSDPRAKTPMRQEPPENRAPLLSAFAALREP